MGVGLNPFKPLIRGIHEESAVKDSKFCYLKPNPKLGSENFIPTLGKGRFIFNALFISLPPVNFRLALNDNLPDFFRGVLFKTHYGDLTHPLFYFSFLASS